MLCDVNRGTGLVAALFVFATWGGPARPAGAVGVAAPGFEATAQSWTGQRAATVELGGLYHGPAPADWTGPATLDQVIATVFEPTVGGATIRGLQEGSSVVNGTRVDLSAHGAMLLTATPAPTTAPPLTAGYQTGGTWGRAHAEVVFDCSYKITAGNSGLSLLVQIDADVMNLHNANGLVQSGPITTPPFGLDSVLTGPPPVGLRIYRNSDVVLDIAPDRTAPGPLASGLLVPVAVDDVIRIQGAVIPRLQVATTAITAPLTAQADITFTASLLLGLNVPISGGDPGTSSGDPLLPPGPTPPAPPGQPLGPTWQFVPIVIGAGGPGTSGPIFFDPDYAIGYRYETNPASPKIAKVLLPAAGDDLYDLYSVGATWDDLTLVQAGVAAGSEFTLPTALSRLVVLGIEASAMVDPTDPNGFVTGLTFDSAGTVQLEMTAITPEPASALLLGAGILFLARRRR